MRFEIRHETVYGYSAPVRLGPQLLRLRPRYDGAQQTIDYECLIEPAPSRRSVQLDAYGNLIEQAWFLGETSELRIVSRALVDTLRTNPFDYLLEPSAVGLPFSYPAALRAPLAGYRDGGEIAPEVIRLANSLAAGVRQQPVGFLVELSRWLSENIDHEVREQGIAHPPEVTLAKGRGACRDVAMLFIAVCRHQGIAARYVTGYQARSAVPRERRYMHAWPEVYLPGGGWRGFDPTHGIAVADAHVAVAAAPGPEGAAPVSGSFSGESVSSTLTYEVRIDVGE
jgi:transglutaminase-like putative cysteine protease